MSFMSRRLAILRSFTVEPVIPLLRAGAFLRGIDLSVYMGDFNAYAQEILDASSALYRFEPDTVLLAAQTRDVAPDLWSEFADLNPEQVQAAVTRVADSFRSQLTAFRSHSRADLIVHSLELPQTPARGILDTQSEPNQLDAIRRINHELSRVVRGQTGVYILDYDSLVARHGRLEWHDERKWLSVRMPIEANHLVYLADEWLRFVVPLAGRKCKVLVTDLDNTLWGGVIGEDGMAGIKLGIEYPGAAYRNVQRAMLDLYARGILLAVASKNNPTDAMQVLEQHPAMLLRPSHFAALRVNWNDKVQSLREIAAELNIGIDAVAFIDDNPAERQWVQGQLPEVTVIDLPDDPASFAAALRDCPVFERTSVSSEDRERGRYYAEQRLRTELEQTATTREDFLRSLQMEVRIELVKPETVGRVAQLTQKTNQFNLTTRRYSEQQVSEMASQDDWHVYTAQVLDRFGDNGLVGVAITHRQGDVCEVDTFLLSCRVIGRTVETSLLVTVAEQASSEGAAKLVGQFLPTKKNAPAKDFYPSHGLVCTSEEAGGSRWELDLASLQVQSPSWIKRSVRLERGTP
jgi:FkbH-like protein